MNFICTLFAALIGATLAPYVANIITFKGSIRDCKLKYLEESYKLSLEIADFCRQNLTESALITANYQKNKKIEGIVGKKVMSPFIRLKTLLDYHLNFDSSLILKIDALNKNIILSQRLLSETITKILNGDVRPRDNSLLKFCDCVEEADNISSELVVLIKQKKTLIENKSNIVIEALSKVIKAIQIKLPQNDQSHLD